MKKITLLCFALSLVVCAALFNLKSRVNALNAEIAETKLQIAEEEQSLHVLRAEWAHVSQPAFLQYLVDAYTSLAPQQAQQFASLAALPDAVTTASITPQNAAQQAQAASATSGWTLAQAEYTKTTQ